MNRLLPDAVIRSVCRELLRLNSRATGRRLTRELRTRFGAVGRAERVFRIWREESEAVRAQAYAMTHVSSLPTDTRELQQRLEIAEKAAADLLARAERAELREQAHQDHWALEIDRLRLELAEQPAQVGEIRRLRAEVSRLTIQLASAPPKPPGGER